MKTSNKLLFEKIKKFMVTEYIDDYAILTNLN